MTIGTSELAWRPEFGRRGGPRYRAIADALAQDILEGRLMPGQRLPTHRDLADALGVTVGTVSRAYREAGERGLVAGEVGRGTFVLDAEGPPHPPALEIRDPSDRSLIDLSLNFLRAPGQALQVARALAGLSQEPDAARLLAEYHPQAGLLDHREAGAEFVGGAGVQTQSDRVLVCAGAQHAMTVALLGLTRPGDVVLTGRVTYPTMISLARVLHLRLEGVAMDEEGIVPDALEAACKAHRPRALYCMPNIQNPSTCVMSGARRRAIAAVASRQGLAVIEDDVYGFLLDDVPEPLCALAPDRTYFITSCSKSVAPGLRIGYLVVPPGNAGRFLDALWSTAVMAPPLMAELATRWIHSGAARELALERRAETRMRQGIAKDHLVGNYDTHPCAYHVWLRLPHAWHAASFVARAQQRGVAVVPGESFAVGELDHAAVRVSLGAARDRGELTRGLDILSSLLRGSDAPRVV